MWVSPKILSRKVGRLNSMFFWCDSSSHSIAYSRSSANALSQSLYGPRRFAINGKANVCIFGVFKHSLKVISSGFNHNTQIECLTSATRRGSLYCSANVAIDPFSFSFDVVGLAYSFLAVKLAQQVYILLLLPFSFPQNVACVVVIGPKWFYRLRKSVFSGPKVEILVNCYN
jgi:hypothetical protein